MTPEVERRAFLLAPFHADTRAEVNEKHRSYVALKKMIPDQFREIRGFEGLSRLLAFTGFAKRRSFGTIVDLDALTRQIHTHPLSPILQTIFRMTGVASAKENRKSHLETLQLVRQLDGLGFAIKIKDYGDPRHRTFIRAAMRAGAEVEKAGEEERKRYAQEKQLLGKVFERTTWARDMHVKIDGEIERPIGLADYLRNKQTRIFGEGGAMVQVGPKEWVVEENVLQDPRIKKYQSRGHRFYPMPMGLHYDTTFSDLFETPIHMKVPHIDFNIGGVPEKKIVAIDPHYLAEHKADTYQMKDRLHVKLVEVPEEEANRHPANFLPLGEGRVLVDSGAPKFIQRLREAGVEVIPTKVPLDSLLVNKGGLHCLFNEL